MFNILTFPVGSAIRCVDFHLLRGFRDCWETFQEQILLLTSPEANRLRLDFVGCVAILGLDLGSDDISDALFQICKAFLTADLDEANLETFFIVLSRIQVIGLSNVDWDFDKARINFTVRVYRTFRLIVAFNDLISAIFAIEESPNFFVHKLEMLFLADVLMQVSVIDLFFEAG